MFNLSNLLRIPQSIIMEILLFSFLPASEQLYSQMQITLAQITKKLSSQTAKENEDSVRLLRWNPWDPLSGESSFRRSTAHSSE